MTMKCRNNIGVHMFKRITWTNHTFEAFSASLRIFQTLFTQGFKAIITLAQSFSCPSRNVLDIKINKSAKVQLTST